MPFINAKLEGDAINRLQFLSRTRDNMLQRLVESVAEAVLPYLKEAAPVGEHFSPQGGELGGGTLRESLNWQMGELGANLMGVEYGRIVIAGSPPHMIYPRRAKALHFWWARESQEVFRKSVRHPGHRPNDFRQKGLQEAFDTMAVQNTIERVVGQWLQGEAV